MGQSPNSVSMLGQRRIRVTCIEPAMGFDSGPTLNRYWVGRPTQVTRDIGTMTGQCWANVVDAVPTLNQH